jgi:uncharacterized NAD(P)/FAD-binding protein YdhS
MGICPVLIQSLKHNPSFYDEFMGIDDIGGIFKVIIKHMGKAAEMGYDKNAVIDSLRPYTPELWMKLPITEKSRFLRHLFRYWEIIRSRIPRESEAIVNQMVHEGRLIILTGRIKNIVATESGMDIFYSSRGQPHLQMETANLLVNCIGPELDYEKVDCPLIKNVLLQGIAQPDPLHLGLNATPNGALIHSDGTESKTVSTIGPPLRGILWEAIAVPEIRLQAEQLAHRLLEMPGSTEKVKAD